jgi:hypothetical protein
MQPPIHRLSSHGIAPALRGGTMSIRFACALAAVALAACTQGEGETCQRDRDCDDGLVCVIATGSPRSVCRSPEDIEEVDAGADAGEPELPPDEEEDAGIEPEPDAGTDAEPPDGADAGSE